MNSRRTTTALRWLRRLTVSLAVFAGTAQAATFNAVWDPPFGSPFSTLTAGLGWRGNATIEVPDSCEPSGTSLVDNYGILPFIPGNCGGLARVTSAEVELYSVAAPGPIQPTLATLTFDPTSFRIGVLRYVGGELEGMFTDFSNFLTPASDPGATNADFTLLAAFGPLNPFTTAFSLIFIDGPRLAWIDCGPPIVLEDGPLTHNNNIQNGRGECVGGINSDIGGFRPQLTVTRVPEPGSLALVGLALLLALPRSGRAKHNESRG